MTDLALRLAALLQLATLLACGLGWHLAHRDHIPRPAWLLGWGYGYVVGLVAVAITLNTVLTETVTAGTRAVSLGLIPATAWALWLTGREIHATARHAHAVLAWADGLAHLEPCSNPDCVEQRRQAAALRKQQRP